MKMQRKLTPGSPPAQGHGFTLVELLVAISILAMVAVLGWRGLDGIVRARVALTNQMETTRGMQLAFAQMQSDCEHVASQDIMDQRPYLLADKDRLTLVRLVSTENEPTRLQVVAYRVVDGTLTRRESVATRDLNQLDGLWKAMTSNSDTTPQVTLQAGVVAMQVLIWQNNQWRSALQTQASVGLPLPPTGVQVQLTAHDQKVPMTKAFLLGGRI
ncbi:MAG: prepilin-type N-terminal cleavage/methylation domain-containing protein [Telluria sp.]